MGGNGGEGKLTIENERCEVIRVAVIEMSHRLCWYAEKAESGDEKCFLMGRMTLVKSGVIVTRRRCCLRRCSACLKVACK